ncbi:MULTISPECIES: ankyrin repeat domain-containing protein [Gammaproteobacteria]|uniref:ankyrin repeat domain-containing protein n=1 Tax=Gammaproteobacteria TaxID=1236 RepID=UPI001914A4FC|nr:MULTISPECIES: ankyrin repeat domain-containing protein [Gammaproteobacteria]MBK5303803.1 ankyrin repeat domain-containing protein [Bacillus sp. TH86]MBK5323572.1 ankyrin repeat domain-containing protein [Bacillus sp. TH59]MBK5338522.1 ankyrin repeat domain-containing protein [Bacillus sp. TH57]MBK5312576.1 ankyrin repeat domain-containing protein [Pseudomonas sp. TH71]MBK5318070.1 ankyrin repeat domain-containing protein [Erwinia sp. TH79]
MKLSWSVFPLLATAVSVPAFAADQVECKQIGQQMVVTTKAGAAVYAINGTARSMAREQGWIDGKSNYEPAEMTRLLQQGLANCASNSSVEQSASLSAAPTTTEIQPSSQNSPMTTDVFISAAVAGDIPTLKRYIDAGFDVNAKGTGVPALGIEGSPAINGAAASGQCAALDFLLAAGAKADLKEKRVGDTPLSSAAQKGAPRCVRSLLAKGARVDIRTEAGGDTPLILAAYYGHLEVAKLLVEHGASLKLKNKDGDTPYRAAVVMGNNQVAQYLKSKGGN